MRGLVGHARVTAGRALTILVLLAVAVVVMVAVAAAGGTDRPTLAAKAWPSLDSEPTNVYRRQLKADPTLTVICRFWWYRNATVERCEWVPRSERGKAMVWNPEGAPARRRR